MQKALQAELRRQDLLEETDRYLDLLIAEVGVPSAAQRARETQAGAALSQMAARFGAGNDAIASVVRRQQDLKASLDSLEKRITTELGAPDGKRNDALITAVPWPYSAENELDCTENS